MDQKVSMTTFIVILLLIIMPTASESQTINAHVGKRNIYLDSGKVTRGLTPPGGTDVYDIRFSKHGSFERLVFETRDTTDGKPSKTPCFFEVTYEQYPFRLVVDLDNTRLQFSADFPNFSNSDYISGKYYLPSETSGNYKFALALKKPIKFEVFELHNPGRIVIDIKAGAKNEKDFSPIYSLRSKSYYFDDLRDQEDKMELESVRIIKSQDKKYVIEEGYYKTVQEAMEKKDLFIKKGIELFVEKRRVNELPQGTVISHSK
jgi:hypothetical protein